jgi:single-stranded-DNA-specific exonuclease
VKKWPDHSIDKVHLAYRLDINEFRGKQSVQLMAEHMEKHS